MPNIAGHEPGLSRSASLRVAHQTLAQQMRMSKFEIEERKRLLGITEDDTQLLFSCKAHIHGRIDHIVEEFYEIQTETPEIALVIGDTETLSRLKRAMRAYILEIFGGTYDADYVNKRLRVGKVHKRIGVSPKLYTTALRILQSLLERELESEVDGAGAYAAERRVALQKLFMFDIQLVFDTYIASLVAELEVAKYEVERYALSLEEQVAERTRELAELSRLDPLTGIANQRSFYEHLRRECGAAERSSEPLGLLYIDLNGFKLVNDSRGHQAGDEVLMEVSTAVRQASRATDIACRYGGDEFYLIMPRTNAAQAPLIAQRIAEGFDASRIGVSLSMGIAIYDPAEPVGIDDLIKTADQQMYRAKAQSRGSRGHCVFMDGSPALEPKHNVAQDADPHTAPAAALPAG